MAKNPLDPKRDKRSKAKKQADFLMKLVEYVSFGRACRLAKVPRGAVYIWLKDDAAFKEKYNEACFAALQSLEDEAIRRAFEGLGKHVYYQGQKIGTVREFSDTLLMALLKAKAPGKYRDRAKPGEEEKDDTGAKPKPQTIIKWGDREIPI
jgi:hypothetical protein